MGIQANPFSLRISDEIMQKLKVLAERSSRSLNKEIEFQLKTIIFEYEQNHGTIPIPNRSGEVDS